MKRLNEDSVEKANKRMRLTTLDSWRCLPPEIWEMIVGYAGHSGGLNLLSTSSFFASTIRDEVKQAIFLDLLRKHIFDYADASEWKNCTQLPQVSMNRVSFEQVIYHFVTKLQVAAQTMEKIKPDQSKFMNKHDFQSLLNDAIREGNLLIVKKLKHLFPMLMEKHINSLDILEMTPFAYAAALGREGICCEILSKCNPFEQEVSYEIVTGINFTMRTIHILALRSNKNCLLHIFQHYNDFLGDVFEENFEAALLDILNNNAKSLEQKLMEDESLLQAMDDSRWPLVKWATCFPDSIDCLELLLQKNALIRHEKSLSVTYVACATGNLLGLKNLLKAGEKIKPFMNGSNMLHLAAYNGHADVVEYLITHYKGMNTINENEETPLMMARMTHHYGVRLSPDMLAKKVRCVEILLANGAIEAVNAVLDSSDESDSDNVFKLEDLFRIR